MCFSKIARDQYVDLRKKMHQAVDRFCDGFESGHEDMKLLQGTDSLFDDMDTETEDEESNLDIHSLFDDMDTETEDEESNLDIHSLFDDVDTETEDEESNLDIHSSFDDVDTETEDEESVSSRLAVFVDDVNNAMMDTLRADCETNSPESVALLEDVDQEVRRRSARTLRHVVNTKEAETGEPEPATEPEPAAEAAAKPKKGFLARVWRMFVGALKCLRRVWRRVLARVQEKLVACWRFVCKVVKGVVDVLGGFCSWVVKVFL